MPFGLEREVINQEVYERTLQHLGEAGVRLPHISALADPANDRDAPDTLRSIDPDTPDAQNLFRVHWYNDARFGEHHRFRRIIARRCPTISSFDLAKITRDALLDLLQPAVQFSLRKIIVAAVDGFEFRAVDGDAGFRQ